MGSRICVGMKPKSKLFFRPVESFQNILERIRSCLQSHLNDQGIDFISELTIGQNCMQVSIHPAEEMIKFSVESDYLICSAKTSSAGPGYHSFVISILETIENKCNFKWIWNDDEKGFCDEAGYYDHRNFLELQNSMCRYLCELSSHLSGSEDTRGDYYVSLNKDHLFQHNSFAISPMGFWEKKFFDDIALLEPSQIHAQAEQFFPWWNKDLDGSFWRNVGLVKMWTEIKWQPPMENGDTTHLLLNHTLRCFNKAIELSRDQDIQLPLEEIGEIQTLLESEDYFTPKQGNIGFHRLNLPRPLMGKWTIQLPGYFYEVMEENERSVKYFHSDKSVRSSSFADPTGKIPVFPDDKELEKDILKTFSFERDAIVGTAILITAPKSEGGYPILICHVAAPGTLSTTIIAIDEMKNLNWAEETFKSIRLGD